MCFFGRFLLNRTYIQTYILSGSHRNGLNVTLLSLVGKGTRKSPLRFKGISAYFWRKDVYSIPHFWKKDIQQLYIYIYTYIIANSICQFGFTKQVINYTLMSVVL